MTGDKVQGAVLFQIHNPTEGKQAPEHIRFTEVTECCSLVEDSYDLGPLWVISSTDSVTVGYIDFQPSSPGM